MQAYRNFKEGDLVSVINEDGEEEGVGLYLGFERPGTSSSAFEWSRREDVRPSRPVSGLLGKMFLRVFVGGKILLFDSMYYTLINAAGPCKAPQDAV